MIHLEAGHPIVAETVAARVHAEPDQHEAVDVRCSDFGAQYYICVQPEQKSVLRVSLWLRCFEEVLAQVGESFFQDRYGSLWESPAQPGYSVTLRIDLLSLPSGRAEKDAIVRQCATLKRDVSAAPLWLCFQALLDGTAVERPHYSVHYRADETFFVLPRADECVIVVFMMAFDSQVEQALAKVFLQEAEISRRQSRDLASAPSIAFTQEPPHELKSLAGVSLSTPACFTGFISIAVSQRTVEKGKLEKAITLIEGYRAFLTFHIKACKSQLHSRIRTRSSNWMQVLNRAVPEKVNAREKKTISGRTFKR